MPSSNGGFVRINADTLSQPMEAEPLRGRIVKTYEQRRLDESAFTRQEPPRVSVTGAVAVRDSRFKVSELARPHLPVHEEERRAVENEVRRQLDALSKETYEAALAKGLEEGREQGRREARERALEESKPLLDRFEALTTEFEGLRHAMLEANERALVELVLRVARKVCLDSTVGDSGYVERLIRAMVEQSGVRENIRIRLNPAQLEAISGLREGLARSLGELKNLQIELSGDVPDGGCELETDFNSMKADIDSQIAAIHEAMVEK